MNVGDIYAGLKLITPPTQEPWTLSDVTIAERLLPPGVDPDQDAYVNLLIPAVRQHLEQSILKRALLTQTWELYLNNWPGRDYVNWNSMTSEIREYYKYNHIKLPFPPLQSVTSITYMNSSGVLLTMNPANFAINVANSYNVYTNTEPGQVVLPYAGIWPTDILMPGAPITIRFVCGYQRLNDTSPPSGQTILSNWEGFGPVTQAMKLVIADCWENRIPAPDAKNSEQLNVASKWLMPYRIYD